MVVFLNGRLVSEDKAVVSVFDRSFLYGDGLFETLCVCNSKPFRWTEHFERLNQGAAYLKIRLPYSNQELLKFIDDLIAENHATDSILRITLSRGIGIRGYSPKGAGHPNMVMSLHAPPSAVMNQPAQWTLITASVRLPANQPLAQFKTCNKLPQIVARAEADEAGADEALLLNTENSVVEGSSSNLFWIQNRSVCTPALVSGILPGVTRAVVMEIARKLNFPTCEVSITREQLRQTQGIFLSVSTIGLAEGLMLDNVTLNRSPIVKELWTSYWDLVRRETR